MFINKRTTEPMQLNIYKPIAFDMQKQDLQFFLVAKLYEAGKVSFGQGAEMLGISKRTFIESLGLYDVSVFDNSTQDLYSDIENA
jgi:predicted HTH domain antitoxin